MKYFFTLLFLSFSTHVFSQCDNFHLITNGSHGDIIYIYLEDTVVQCQTTGNSQNINCPTAVKNLILNSTIVKIGDCVYECTSNKCEVINVLPVQLIYFKAVPKESDNYNLLEFATESELNNREFIIEKSLDATNFYKLGALFGHGNSNRRIEYSYKDFENSESCFYRLKQVDFDGKFTYSKIVHVDMDDLDNPDYLYYDLYGHAFKSLKNAPQGLYIRNNKKYLKLE